MKPINTSIFDFPTLISSGFVYVDKTAQIYELAKPNADRIYFFPRPRRFGKSLLISTLKALFQGRRELFRGLAIEKTDWDWEHEVYPVLHLDMSVVAARFVGENLPVHYVGVNYNPAADVRTIDDVKCERVA